MQNEFKDLEVRVDFGNVEQMAKDCWLFLTNDSLPERSMVKREAFYHEVSAMIETCRQHYAKEKLEQAVQAYDEYIKLLGDELEELIGVAHAYGAHDWRSSRFEKGMVLREKIKLLKAQSPPSL